MMAWLRVKLFLALLAFFGITASNLSAESVIGVIESRRDLVIKSKLQAQIMSLSISEGQRVEQGDEILRFECEERNFDVQSALLSLEALKLKLDNSNKLLKLNGATKEAVRLLEIDLANAELQLDVAISRETQCVLRAPFSGFIPEIYIEPFASVQTGDGLLRVVDIDTGWVEFIAPVERMLTVGDKVRITGMDGQSRQIPVTSSSVIVDPASQTIIYRADLEELSEAFPPGLTISVEF